MPGENCCMNNCSTSRSSKYKGIGLFKLPSAKLYPKLRQEWIRIITKYRDLDASFKQQLESDRVHVCEKHFKEQDIDKNDGGRKRVKYSCDAVPTVNLPQKSIPERTVKERKWRTHEETQVDNLLYNENSKVKYKNLADVFENIKTLKCTDNWDVQYKSSIVLKKNDYTSLIPFLKVEIDDGLGFTIMVYDWFLPEDHDIYKQNRRSLKFHSIASLVNDLNSYTLCEGTNDEANLKGKLIHHVVPQKLVESDLEIPLQPYSCKIYHRVKDCVVLNRESRKCESCETHTKKTLYSQRAKNKKNNEPLSKYAPLTQSGHDRLVISLKESRLKCHVMLFSINYGSTFWV